MRLKKRPYLVVPLLVEQPTWGGSYIASYKGWQTLSSLSGKNIGQSFELYGQSTVSFDIFDSSDPHFLPAGKGIPDTKSQQTISLFDEVAEAKGLVVGPYVWQTWQAMPILIKFTQAKGNSFQLHAKPSQATARWKPKAESWYFFEKGILTYGVNQKTKLEDYKKTCHEIDDKMKSLSTLVTSGKMTVSDAKKEAKEWIDKKNPWQYINVHEVAKDTLIDLSPGGLHHSWEDRPEITPDGNIVYEVQQDVADDDCTLRSFDQGKFKDDGTIRTIYIDDYFSLLDPDPQKNDIKNATLTPVGSSLLKTKNYSMDVLTVTNTIKESIGDSFVHLFVKEGKATITGPDGVVHIHKGHSCFIPHNSETYTIQAVDGPATLIKTYIEKQ
jgi:mannose-6-phosphate isomerase class I